MKKFNGDSSAPGRQSSSSHDNPPAESGGHPPPPPPPPPPRPQRLAVPAEAGRFITSEVKHKIIVGVLLAGAVGSVGLLGYEVKQLVNQYKGQYVSLLSLSCLHLTKSQTF